ncbi:MAG: hypothetical protein O3A91_09305, partial [Proteobacteria bacterium]|nr:hypothetical protein [Pseudomonadota bacterium]
ERAGEPGHPPGHQGFRQLADHPAALRQRRVRRRLGHHEGDAPVGRTAEAAGRVGATIVGPLSLPDASEDAFGFCRNSGAWRKELRC